MYRVAKQYEGVYHVIDSEDGERVARVARAMPGPMVSVNGQGGLYSPALARAIARAMSKLARDLEREKVGG